MNIVHGFKKLAPRQQFLILVLSFYGLEIIFRFLPVIYSTGVVPMFNVTIWGQNFSVTTHFFQLAERVLEMLILIKLYKSVGYGLNDISRIGLVIMMVCSCSILLTVPFELYVGKNVFDMPSVLLYIPTVLHALGFIGNFLFLVWSPLVKAAKVFALCYGPVMSLALTGLIYLLSEIAPEIVTYVVSPITYWVISLSGTLILYLILRKSLEIREEERKESLL